jgi:hypothetical protein
MSILYYFIDEETRKLRPEAAHKVVAQKDHNADVIRVGIPETMDSVDLETSAVRCMYQRPKETEVRSKTATYYDTSGGYLWYDWTLQEGDTAKAGKINFSVCLQHIEGGLLTVDWNTTIGEIFVKTSYHSDDSDEGDETITPTVAQRVAVLESMIQRVASGAPIVVSSASAMTDTDQIYVLSTDGEWYYHNGSAWVAGGEYGGVANGSVTTDKLADGAVTTAKIADGAVTAGKLANELKEGLYQRPVAMKTFVIPAGESHSSTKDQLYVDIKAGQNYVILWKNADQAYVRYADGTYITSTKTPIEGIAEKDIVSIGLYKGSASADVEASIIAFNNPVGYDLYSSLRDLDVVKHVTLGKNLVDNVTQVYFPVYIKAGTPVTWACEDREPLVPATFNVYFYAKNKEYVCYYGSASESGKISRTVTPSTTTDIYYIRLERASSYEWRPLQIELGTVATDYEPYIPNNLALSEEIKENAGYLSKNIAFTVAANKTHSSTIDKLPYKIKAGETYGVFIKTNSARTLQLYEYNGQSGVSKGTIKANTFVVRTSTTGATHLSLFVGTGSSDDEFTLIAYRNDSINGVLADSIPDANIIDVGSRAVEFSVNAGNTHSSSSNQITLAVAKDEFFYCVATGVQERNANVFVRNGNTEVNVGSIADGFIARFKAPIYIEKMGLFLGSGTESASVTFAAFAEKSVLSKLTEKAEYNNQYLVKLLNAKRKANPGRYDSQTSPDIFTLAHFSDIHGSVWAMKKVQEFKDTYKDYLDDVICTGDIVSDKIADGTAFWSSNSDGEILVCIGNHDSLGSDGWANPVSQQTLYATYIEPYEEKWNAETVSGHSYWYKDYPDKKIRLIAVDATIYDAAEQASQMTWLNEALNGAAANGYAVVGAIHFPPMPADFKKIDSNFTALLHGTAGDMSQFAWHTYHTEILTAVGQFIDNGGDFVCWLSGHTHYDLLSYDNRFPKQLFVTISCAMASSLFEEKVRDAKRGSGLVMNTVCVDTVRKYVKLIRYGAEWDDCLRHTGTCVIKYDANPPQVMFSN